MSEIELTESDIYAAIKIYVAGKFGFMALEDMAVCLEIDSRYVRARVRWEDNIKQEEIVHGC